MNISWDVFKCKNSDPRTAFENMCRLLFKYKYFDNTVSLHSNTNNPGIEVEPVYCEKLSKRISFQAKFFDSRTDYKQIKESVETTIKYYEDRLDLLVIYANTDINTDNASHKQIHQLLSDANIELELITNQEILDQVILSSLISNAYFGNCILDIDWFQEHIDKSITSLGERHNSFNIETNTDELLSIFIRDDEGVKILNNRKTDALEELKKNIKGSSNYEDFIKKFINEIQMLDDLTPDSITECFNWQSTIQDHLKDYIESINERIIELNESLKTEKEYDKNHRELLQCERLLSVFDLISIDMFDKNLINNKMLIISGDAGTGKTHLISEKASNIIKSNHAALLLLGQNFISEDYIISQIPKMLGLDCSFNDLLDRLEVFGEVHNCIVPIFIDAINESAYKKPWKQGLGELFSIVNKYNNVKIIVSYRNGYESLLFDDATKEEIGSSISSIDHYGFIDNSLEAINQYLNAYDIPFSPSFLLDSNFTNPLFLKLFCKTYNKDVDVDIEILFERLIANANKEVCDAFTLAPGKNYVKELLNELCQIFLANDKGRSIPYQDLLDLKFWNSFGLTSKKIDIIHLLTTNGIINSYALGDNEYCYLGYNLLEDFLISKAIFNMFETKDEVKSYIISKLLDIKNGKLINRNNSDIFGACANMYFEKYQEELIAPILELLQDQDSNILLCKTFLKYYRIRKGSYTDFNFFYSFINENHIDREIVFDILIYNAFKVNHPLNVNALHEILFDKPLAKRDYLWTTYINGFASDDRVFYLIDLISKGKSAVVFNNDSIELVLILFAWLLTSSNILLRDTASRAMIEILKCNFSLCKDLLHKFENINDPYVIQRLYAIVFGACTKRNSLYETEYRELVIYIYQTIFNKDLVYPDILLREYAMLIIELYVHDFGSLSEINFDKIRPPYKSEPIPIIANSPYIKDQKQGIYEIQTSMVPDNHSGYYGDFGRYVFQSNLENFENVDVVNAYYYALQFIMEDLDYSNILFGDYDQRTARTLSRVYAHKIERIGKKYQWIAMYNILARISDTHYLKSSYSDDISHPYLGTFETFIRNFDPTINPNLLLDPYILSIDLKKGIEEVPFCNLNEPFDIELWLKDDCSLFSNHSSDLVTTDKSENEWVYLYQYKQFKFQPLEETRSSYGYQSGDQIIWKTSKAYIVSNSTFDNLKKEIEGRNFFDNRFPKMGDCFVLYNREAAWSSGFNNYYSNDELEVNTDSGEFEEIECEPLLIEYSSGESLFGTEQHIYQRAIQKSLGNVKQAFLTYLYESQYDGTLKDSIKIDYPCKDIIEYYNLKQSEYDGYYYDNKTLVAFDSSLSNTGYGLLIRKDYLKRFLDNTNKKIIWISIGEKQFFSGDHNSTYQEWSGFSHLSNGTIIGEMYPAGQND